MPLKFYDGILEKITKNNERGKLNIDDTLILMWILTSCSHVCRSRIVVTSHIFILLSVDPVATSGNLHIKVSIQIMRNGARAICIVKMQMTYMSQKPTVSTDSE